MTNVAAANGLTLIDELLAEQHQLTAVERFASVHEVQDFSAGERFYRSLLPVQTPGPGEQYAFTVDLDACSGCKACVTACHNVNGLEDAESWRRIGLLHSPAGSTPFLQTVTTACHHCVDPGCLNGCPVLAYDKDPVTGIVRHLDDQCMGCQYCVMKCPYEVPQYSARLGIVRKCDLCANRLEAGRSTACAEACPNHAIRITLVQKAEVARGFRQMRTLGDKPLIRFHSENNKFLPDSPNPQITLPTTRYLSRRVLPEGLLSADHGAPRLDNPHWPLVFMLVLTQAAAGTLVATVFTQACRLSSPVQPMQRFALGALLLGLAASIFHLGQPLKAWRAFLGWRKSWLSREVIALNLLAVVAALLLIAPWLSVLAGWQFQLRWLAALIGIAAVFASAMVYVDTQRPFWSARFVFGNFLGTTLLLGATTTALIFAWTGQMTVAIQTAALAATLIRSALFLWRWVELRSAVGDSFSPTHFNARVIYSLLPWAIPAQTLLFAVSTIFGLFAISIVGQGASWWASLAWFTTFGSEIVARYIFFAASASKRMPGGIPA